MYCQLLLNANNVLDKFSMIRVKLPKYVLYSGKLNSLLFDHKHF